MQSNTCLMTRDDTSLIVCCLCVIRFVSWRRSCCGIVKSSHLKEGQRYAGRIYVYRVIRNHRTVPHGIYVVDGNKLKRMKRMTFVEFSIEAEDRYDG